MLDDHLRGCPSCRKEIDVIAPLAAALTRVDPDDLDESHDPPAPDQFPAILRRINAERAGPGGSAPEDTGTEHRGADPNATAGPAGPGTGGGEVVAFRTRPRPPLRSRLLVAAAGLVIALAGVSAGVALAPDAAEVSVEAVAVQTLAPGVDVRAGVVGPPGASS